MIFLLAKIHFSYKNEVQKNKNGQKMESRQIQSKNKSNFIESYNLGGLKIHFDN